MFWLTVFSVGVKLIGWLSSISGWLHDRGQQQLSEKNLTLKAQAAALKTMSASIQASRTATRAELETKLKEGKL